MCNFFCSCLLLLLFLTYYIYAHLSKMLISNVKEYREWKTATMNTKIKEITFQMKQKHQKFSISTVYILNLVKMNNYFLIFRFRFCFFFFDIIFKKVPLIVHLWIYAHWKQSPKLKHLMHILKSITMAHKIFIFMSIRIISFCIYSFSRF